MPGTLPTDNEGNPLPVVRRSNATRAFPRTSSGARSRLPTRDELHATQVGIISTFKTSKFATEIHFAKKLSPEIACSHAPKPFSKSYAAHDGASPRAMAIVMRQRIRAGLLPMLLHPFASQALGPRNIAARHFRCY